jgi:hypothetical protein
VFQRVIRKRHFWHTSKIDAVAEMFARPWMPLPSLLSLDPMARLIRLLLLCSFPVLATPDGIEKTRKPDLAPAIAVQPTSY